MNIETLISEMQKQVTRTTFQIAWLRKHKVRLAALPEGSFYTNRFDFDRLTHPEIIQVIKTIGGKWAKEPSGVWKANRLHGRTDGVVVCCYAGNLRRPKIVEYEEEVPAQKVTRRKLVCPEVAA
jgi:hypothetical protein